VIDSARSITATPFGGEAHAAAVLDQDAQLDLALLATAEAFPDAASEMPGEARAAGSARRVALGDAASLAAGDEVLAVGSPLQMYFSVSHGVVSYVHRLFDGVDFVQTDAPINAGNSGGPLFDRHARVVGVISFILRDSQRLAFALPIERAVARFAAQLAAWPQQPRHEPALARARSLR
jgi:serine protease Do